MKNHTQTLWHLATELFAPEEVSQIRLLTETEPFNFEQMISFDESLGGPGISHINCERSGRYEIADRDIFRPLQYCGSYFKIMFSKDEKVETAWLTRDIVEMSSSHIEGLIKRIGNILKLPLGAALRNKIVKQKVDAVTWCQIETYTHIYNSAKHDFSQDKDTHMFSVEDATLAYLVCRKLGAKLYPLADLATDIKIFEKKCDEAEKARLPQWKVNPFGEKSGHDS